VSSCSIAVNYRSSMSLIDASMDSTYTRYFLRCSYSLEASEYPHSAVYIPGEERSVVYTEHEAILNFPWDMMRRGETILYAGYPFIEAQRQSRETLTCHAAACSVAGTGILLQGKEGAGKSSTLYHLCRN